MSFGFSGVHRTGKTTTAKEVAARMQLPFIETTVSDVWRGLGVDPSKPMSFQVRMQAQYQILETLAKSYSQHRVFVSDRTPIDLMAYTLADVSAVNEVDHSVLVDYLQACAEAATTYFSAIMVIQPGIPYVNTELKGNDDRSYMELLNTIMRGCMTHPKLTGLRANILSEDVTDLEYRIRLGVSFFDSHRNVQLKHLQEVRKALH